MKIKILSILALLLTVTQGAWAANHVKSVTYRPAGTIGGQFTINGSGDKVYFSKGNLQLVGENSWKFADNQWETFGENQSDNHRDLFGWCTVATPNKTSEVDYDYSSDTDWGDDPYLQACLGSGWHLITGGNSGKWNYLLNSRTTTSGIRYAVGNVNGKNGLILLPDDWNAEYYALNNTNKDNGHYDNNNISLSDWTEKLEAHGAVFLPAGGHRIGTNLFVVNTVGHYWCSTYQANGDVMRIDDGQILPNWVLNFYYGCSIRLVRDVAEYYDEVTLTDGEAITGLDDYKGKEIWVNYTRSFTADKASTVCLPFAYTKKTGDGSFYAFSGIEKVGSEYIATMTEPGTSTLTANTPYLYKAATTGDADFSGTYAIPASITAGETTSGDWTFKGTYSTIEWTDAPEEPTYGFSAQAANDGITQGQFVKVGSYVRIKPMRAYLQYTGSDSQFANARALMTRAAATTSDDTLPETIGVRLISANGEVTAIGTLHTRTGEVSFDSEAWYTLDGKRLNAKPNTKGIYVNNGKKVVIK